MPQYKTFWQWLYKTHNISLEQYNTKSDIMKLAIQEDYDRYKKEVDAKCERYFRKKEEQKKEINFIKNQDWKYDEDYLSYIENGESAAVFIVRDIVNSIDTTGKWIDVISLSTYFKKGADSKRAFNWIIVELFPRNMTPIYHKNEPAFNKYLTWVTAHEDIENQRKSGYHGVKYIVLCNLFNKNKNKFTTHTSMEKKYWEPQSAYRMMEIKVPVDPDWEYRIQAVKKINNKQIKFIRDNESELEEKIRENGRPTLEILGIL